MVRLLSVIHGPAFGGAHNQLLQLAEPLADRGIETVAVLPDEASAAAQRIRRGGVEALTVPLGRLRASADPRLQARFARSLLRDGAAIGHLIEDLGADIVQAHGPTNPQAAIAARRGHRAAVVWQLLDTRAPMVLRRATMPLVRRLADSVTTWGDAVAREHPGAERLGDRLVSVYPPVDAERFAPSPERARAARRELELDDDAVAIGAVGVLNPQKGHEVLIEAAGRMHRTHPELALRILGAPSPAHGEYGARLHADAARLGLQNRGAAIRDPGERVADLIQGLDVFAMASVRRSEGMPTAILEAMVAGKPVVATDVGATRELVADGVSGLLVEPGEAEGLAGALETLLADPELRRSMGAAGRARALERFGLNALADRHRHAYELALDHRRRRTGGASARG